MEKKINNIQVIRPGSAPDVDTDFHTEGREEVLKYCIEKYGRENIANIITFGTFKAKNSFKSMATIYNTPYALANKLSALLPPVIDGNEMTLADVYDPSHPRYAEGEDFRRAAETEGLEELVKMATPLSGRVKSTGVHACFIKGTLIKTDKGLIPIEMIKAGDRVLTHLGRYKEVAEVMINESEDLFEVRTINTIPTTVTSTHPYYARKRKLDKGSISFGSPEWIDVKDLAAGEYVVGTPVNKKEELPELPWTLPIEDNKFWWIAGRFLGDGWCEDFSTTRNKKRKDGTPYKRVDKVRDVVISVGKNDPTRDTLINEVSKLFSYRVDTHYKTVDKIYINNKDVFEYFSTFGKYAKGKKVTEEVQNLPTELLKSFIEGYISADGWHNKKRDTYTFSTVSEELCLSMISCINKAYNTHCSVNLEKRDKMVIEGREVQCQDRYSVLFSKDIRKKPQSFYEDGYIWSKITKTEKKAEETTTTYNLSVYDDNSYIANNAAVHNCGIIFSNQDLSNTIPTQIRQSDGALVTQWTYPQCESLGLIKMDFLGLDTLDIIDNTLTNIRLNGKTPPDMRELINGPMDDRKTFEMLQRGDTVGTFQLGGGGVREVLRRTKPTQFEDIAAITALYRPGPMKMGAHFQYADRKNGEEEVVYISPEFSGTAVEEVLAPTYGLIVYQEQCMQIATKFAGMTPYESDLLRKAIGKKKMKLMMELRPKFIEGILSNGYSEEAANQLWDTIAVFGEYGFNKSHSISYAINAYKTCYLKANYPSEFMAALLQQNINEQKKIALFLQEAKNMGLRVGPVDINNSQVKISATSTSDKYDIVYGFLGVKQVNEEFAEAIVKEREKGGKFTSLFNFINRIKKHHKIKALSLEFLAKSGAFDSLGVNRRVVVEKAKSLVNIANAKQKQAVSLFDMMGDEGSDLLSSVSLEGPEYSYNKLIKNEADTLGLFVSGHPTSNAGVVGRQYSPKLLSDLISKPAPGQHKIFCTFTNIDIKTKRNGAKSIAVRLDDGHDTVDCYLPKPIVNRIEKGQEIARVLKAKEKGDTVKIGGESKRADEIIQIYYDDKVIPISALSTNEFECVTVKQTRRGLTIVDLEHVLTADDGSIPYEIRIPDGTDLKAFSSLLDNNKGNVTVLAHTAKGKSFCRQRVSLSRNFIRGLEQLIGEENIVTKGI